METEERRKPTKTSKKSGKRVKALSAEEEARRREVVKEKLREKLESEKRALQVVERLLDDTVTEDFLSDCARFISPANYKDAVEERFIAKMCGYPLCSQKLGKIPTQQYKISTKTNKVYDITERKCFCSNFCYKASKEFELQISTTPLWLRQHESPQPIKLMKKGDSGSSGQEVILSERCLQEEDIENPSAVPLENPLSSQHRPSSAGNSEGSDMEQEQDFVSSMVSQRQGPRVHWGDLPKRTDDDRKEQTNRRQKKIEKEGKTEEDGNRHISLSCTTEQSAQETDVEEATVQLNSCSLSETHSHSEATAGQPAQNPLPSPPCTNSNISTDSERPPPLAPTDEPGLNITQVGMSRRGAAGLRDLLKNHSATAKQPDSIRLSLLENLKTTLKQWSTAETLKFLYGAEHSQGSPFANDEQEKEEELDEDDLEDEVTNDENREVGNDDVQKKPSAPVPDYETLQKETQQMEIRVREFYKGGCVLPEEEHDTQRDKVWVQDQSRKDPSLPLIDSNAQHLIQKRITVEKLSSCLKDIVGPLRLSMTDISTDLNNLVRTFRFTSTNIIHKRAEWTLIAVVLLHLLSEVSPLVREALEVSASVDYLNTLMEQLGLQEQDLLNLVRLFKTQAH